MKGDFSRLTFDRRKHYTGVRLQQGRVQLDADWNEQDDIAAYQRHTLAADVIGLSGAPEQGGGFQVTVVGDQIRLSHGRYYVDGILCENESEVALAADPGDPGQPVQPDLPDVPLPTAGGGYLAYLDVWQRSVSALEDPDLLEPALGGPDTATRVRTVWQVRLLPFAGSEVPDGWEPDPRPRPVLAARTYTAPQENQLYRVEVHTPGLLGEATFKWSRDNGAVAARIENPASAAGEYQIVVNRQIGPDQAGGFQPDQWLEVTDEGRVLRGEPGVFAPISEISGQVIKVTGWPGSGDPMPAFSSGTTIRRWDSEGEQAVTVAADNDGYLRLDDTVEIRFGDDVNAYYRTGDYWLIPVRAASGALWPVEADEPVPQPPQGVRHHYAPLAKLTLAGSTWSVVGSVFLRKTFQSLTLNPGQEKLNRHEDDVMTASLTIEGNLAVYQQVTVGRSTASGGRLELLRAPLVLATGDGADRGLQFPALSGARASLGYAVAGGAPRLTLAAEAGAALALRQGADERLTVTTGGRVGIRTPDPQKDVHLAGDEILLDAATAVTIQRGLIYKDGSEAAGRVLTSDAQGRATWQVASVRRFGPVFLDFHPLVGSGGEGATGWTLYTLPDLVPNDASGVILQAQAAMNGPNGDPNDESANIQIRKDSFSAGLLLLRGASAGGGDSIAWAGQGIFPIARHSFQYIIGGKGFSHGWRIWLVGYFP